MSARYRTAHPYRDLDVIDARAPRFNQATVGVVSLVAVLTGWWALLGLLALQLGIGLRYGRQYCLPCVAYFELVQPLQRRTRSRTRACRGSRTRSGSSCSSSALRASPSACSAAGAGLGLLVAGLALLAATTGFCAGADVPHRCGGVASGARRSTAWSWPTLAWARRRELLVAFSHPLCTECRSVEAELAAGSDPFVSVDVRDRPDLARKYGVALVPTVARRPTGPCCSRSPAD